MAAQERSSSSVLSALLLSVTLTVIYSAELNIRPRNLATHQMEVGVGAEEEGEGVDMVDGVVGETTMAVINLSRVAIHLTRLLCRTLVDSPTEA